MIIKFYMRLLSAKCSRKYHSQMLSTISGILPWRLQDWRRLLKTQASNFVEMERIMFAATSESTTWRITRLSQDCSQIASAPCSKKSKKIQLIKLHFAARFDANRENQTALMRRQVTAEVCASFPKSDLVHSSRVSSPFISKMNCAADMTAKVLGLTESIRRNLLTDNADHYLYEIRLLICTWDQRRTHFCRLLSKLVKNYFRSNNEKLPLYHARERTDSICYWFCMLVSTACIYKIFHSEARAVASTSGVSEISQRFARNIWCMEWIEDVKKDRMSS